MVSPERARSKILAARSRAAGGRELGSVGGVDMVSVGAVVSVGAEELVVGGGTVVCVEGGREMMAGCGPLGSIGVGCCCEEEEEGDSGRWIGTGMLG